MPFGPRNAPGFYTCMIHVLSTEWNKLFRSRYPDTKHTVDRVIIDYILLSTADQGDLLLYLECVLDVCKKYHLSLTPPKCDFLKARVDSVHHVLTRNAHCSSTTTL